MPPELSASVVIFALWSIALALVAWRCLPLFFQFVGLARLRCEAVELYPAAIAGESTAEYADFKRQALELGFRPLAVLVRRWLLVSGRWSITHVETIYGSNAHECFAGAGLNVHSGILEMGVSSTLANGALIWTNNSLDMNDLTTKELVIQRANTADFAGLLRQHREKASEFKLKGQTLADHEQITTLLDSLQKHFATDIRRWDAEIMRHLFWVCLFNVLAPVAFSLVFCWNTTAIPVAMLVGVLFHTVWLKWLIWRQVHRARRQHARRIRAVR